MTRFGQRVVGLLLGMFVLVTPLLAQEWSAEQKEAWAFEVSYWKAFRSGDVAATLSHIHEDYRGWSYGEYLPSDKASMKRFFDHFFPAGETYVHEERPIAIIVHGNVAVVHYIVSAHSKNESGEHTSSEARWTDTLIKENGRWLLLGDQGGSAARVAN